MSVMIPDPGEKVTYFDENGEPVRAIVVDPVPESEYVTLVTGANNELGQGYIYDVDVHTSIYPHADLGEKYTEEKHAFKPGWD